MAFLVEGKHGINKGASSSFAFGAGNVNNIETIKVMQLERFSSGLAFPLQETYGIANPGKV